MGAVGSGGVLALIILCISPAPHRSTCPPLAVGPKVLQAAAGRCALFPCRYHLCSTSPVQQLSLRWLRDPAFSSAHRDFQGFLLAANGQSGPTRGRLVVDHKGDCSLALPEVTLEDGGYYYGMRLRANLTRQKDESRWLHRVRLNVSASAPPPHISPPPSPLPEGQWVTLTCWTPPGCPDEAPPSLTWDGTAVESGGSQTFLTTPPAAPSHERIDEDSFLLPPLLPDLHPWGGVAMALKFAPTWEMDGTRLRCGRRDPRPGGGWGEEVWNEWRLRVLYAPRDVWVEVTPKSPILEGHGVTLSCRASSNPAPHQYGWSLNGATLQTYGAQLSLLPHSGDAGLYGCTATNSFGAAEATAVRLEVLYPPRSVAVTPLTPLPAQERSRVTLLCRVGPAHPTPTVQWERLDQPSEAAIGPELSFEAEPSRAGAYRCAASNEAGTVRAAAVSVVVWYAPRFARIIQNPPGPQRAAMGGMVTLRCLWGPAHPPPIEVTWFREGVPLHSPPHSGPFLRLRGPRPEDGGQYECEVRNVAGRARSAPHRLEVLYPPRSVSLLADPGPSLTEGASLTLLCLADGNPPPQQFGWERDGEPLGRSAVGRWAMGAVGTAARGRYRCKAGNGVGWEASEPLGVSVRLSRDTIIRRTSGGTAAAVAALLLTGALVWHLRRRCLAPSDADAVVAPMGTFFLRPKKPPMVSAPPGDDDDDDDDDDEDDFSSSSPPPHNRGDAQRVGGDVMLYSVLQRSHGAKVPEGPDYENVPNGATNADPKADPKADPTADPNADPNGGGVLYAALALPPPAMLWGRSGAGNGDSVEYEELRG